MKGSHMKRGSFQPRVRLCLLCVYPSSCQTLVVSDPLSDLCVVSLVHTLFLFIKIISFYASN